MIPLCSRQVIPFTDADGITWRFIPRTGLMEIEFSSMLEQQKATEDESEKRKIFADFIDRILCGWDRGSVAGMPEYPLDKKPSNLFNSREIGIILRMWHEANTVDVEQKKS
jgi:hypothetical protein